MLLGASKEKGVANMRFVGVSFAECGNA